MTSGSVSVVRIYCTILYSVGGTERYTGFGIMPELEMDQSFRLLDL